MHRINSTNNLSVIPKENEGSFNGENQGFFITCLYVSSTHLYQDGLPDDNAASEAIATTNSSTPTLYLPIQSCKLCMCTAAVQPGATSAPSPIDTPSTG